MKLNLLAVNTLKTTGKQQQLETGQGINKTVVLARDWLLATFNHSQLSFVDIRDNKKKTTAKLRSSTRRARLQKM